MSQASLQRTRRTDRLGVHSIDHVCLSVPELDEAERFFTAFGLNVEAAGDALELKTFGSPHVWGVLRKGERKRLEHIGFSIYEDDMDRFVSHLQSMHVDGLEAPADSENECIRFNDPHGVPLEIRVADKVMPDQKTAQPRYPAPEGTRGAALRGDAPAIRPNRMGHALFFTPDIEASIAFYSEALGLRLSDHSGPVAFLHGPHGSEHHMIAFAESSAGVGYHHSSWDVDSIDEVGLGAAQMTEAGYKRGWGLGRHVLGSNYFHYIRDPWGSYAEYSHDIDYIPAKQEWTASYPSPENSLFLWGPEVPEDFVTNYEARAGAGDE